MTKIPLDVDMLPQSETFISESLAAVLEDAIKHEEKSLIDTVSFVIEKIYWKDEKRCKALHLLRDYRFFQSIGKCFLLRKDPNDTIRTHICPSNAINLSRALHTMYTYLIKCVGKRMVDKEYKMSTESYYEESYDQCLRDVLDIETLLNACEELRREYRPLVYNDPNEVCFAKDMAYFQMFKEQLQEVLKLRTELQDENATLLDMVANYANYRMYGISGKPQEGEEEETIRIDAEEGQESKVEGQESKVEGQKSKVEGQESKVKGQKSKVEGQKSKVEGQKSKVEGQESKVEGQKDIHSSALTGFNDDDDDNDPADLTIETDPIPETRINL